MSTYTLRITGKPIEEALQMLEAADGIKAGSRTLSFGDDPGSAQVALSVTVDAPTLEEAQARVGDALPANGSYTVGRPDPLENESDG